MRYVPVLAHVRVIYLWCLLLCVYCYYDVGLHAVRMVRRIVGLMRVADTCVAFACGSLFRHDVSLAYALHDCADIAVCTWVNVAPCVICARCCWNYSVGLHADHVVRHGNRTGKCTLLSIPVSCVYMRGSVWPRHEVLCERALLHQCAVYMRRIIWPAMSVCSMRIAVMQYCVCTRVIWPHKSNVNTSITHCCRTLGLHTGSYGHPAVIGMQYALLSVYWCARINGPPWCCTDCGLHITDRMNIANVNTGSARFADYYDVRFTYRDRMAPPWC
jgi:hypothetical protein